MDAGLRLAGWFGTTWARLYTLGLPESVRKERRALIESDVWEQAHDSESRHAARSMLIRTLAGLSDDLVWRWRTGRQTPPSPFSFEEARPELAGGKSQLAVLSLLCGLALALVAVIVADPFAHSLSAAGALLSVVALAGWAIELREADEESTSSLWPLALAGGVSAVAAGLAYDSGRAGLVVAMPLAVFAGKAWLAAVRERPFVAAEGVVTPVAASALAIKAAEGAAIAYEAPAGQISRRSLLQVGLWLGLGSALAAAGGALVDFLWARKPEAFGGVVVAGHIERFPPGSKTHVLEGKFWLVSLTEEQGGPGFLALWHKCPHLGCTVPWMADFAYTDAETGKTTKGWFRCPCHQSTYDDAGVRVYGPAPRSMDRMEVTFDRDTGRLNVDTGKVTKGAPDNASHALKVENPV